jgi:hypothetical protein
MIIGVKNNIMKCNAWDFETCHGKAVHFYINDGISLFNPSIFGRCADHRYQSIPEVSYEEILVCEIMQL